MIESLYAEDGSYNIAKHPLNHIASRICGSQDHLSLAADLEYLLGIGMLEALPLSVDDILPALASSILNSRQFDSFHKDGLEIMAAGRLPMRNIITDWRGVIARSWSENRDGRPGIPVADQGLLLAPAYADIEKLLAIQSSTVDQSSQLPSTYKIVQLVIEKFPVPDDTTPIHSILEWRQDASTDLQRRALRLWLADVILQNASIEQAALQLEQLLHDYAKSIHVARFKTRRVTLRTLLCLPFAVIEEVLHLRPRKAVEQILSLTDYRATHLELALTGPGHKVAYIDSTRREFG